MTVWARRIATAAALIGLLLALTHWAGWSTIRWLVAPAFIWQFTEIVIGVAIGPSPAQVRLERRAAKQVAYERAVERARYRP